MNHSSLRPCVSGILLGALSVACLFVAAGTAQTGSAPPLTTVFDYPNFSSTAGLTLNGNSVQAGESLLVGYPAIWSIGSVWYTNQVNVAQGFTTSFTLQIDPVPASGDGTTADGMAFVVQNSSVNALGDNDGEPGYQNMADSLAVEFDTYYNTNQNDPNNNHIGVQSCGTLPNSLDHASSCDLGLQPTLPITLADAHPHIYVVKYVPGTGGAPGILSVTVDKQLVLTSNVNLSTLLSLNGNDAWVGFTGGSGSYYERGLVRNWSFSSVGTASPK